MTLCTLAILQLGILADALISEEAPPTGAAGVDTSLWPVVFLHIPKTAGNFATTVMRTGCNTTRIPRDWSAKGSGDDLPDGCGREHFAQMSRGHTPLRLTSGIGVEHAAALFRDPGQRLMSGYFHGRHDCPAELHRVAPWCKSQNSTSPFCLPTQIVTLESVERYAECVGSCMSSIVFGQWCRQRIQADDLPIVLQRIEQMGFVGLTEEYDFSVCMFHARFGGECVAAEFQNRREGIHKLPSWLPFSTHRGYEVPSSEKIEEALDMDRQVYQAARNRFWADMRRYGIDREFCARLCPEHRSVFASSKS